MGAVTTVLLGRGFDGPSVKQSKFSVGDMHLELSFGADLGDNTSQLSSAQSATVVRGAAVVAEELRVSGATPEDWDSFAQRCGASFRAAHAHMAAWKLKNLARYRLRLFELYAGRGQERTKIGQCAVAIARHGRDSLFIDRIQLLSADDDDAAWATAMGAVLAQVGAGDYQYGWVQNLEPPREDALSRVPGVTIANVSPIVVQAVDFSNWASWDEYFRGIGENSRRNAKSAAKNFDDIAVVTKTGLKALSAVPALMKLRTSMSERKGLNLRVSASVAAYIANIISFPAYMMTSIVTGGGRVLSSFYGVEFGENTYYLEGASAPNNGGGAWHLLISMLKRSYDRAPKGKFIMGYVDYSLHREEVGGGLLRSRRSCRVTDYSTSVIKFRVD
jgi:hypothetical protein